MEIPSMTDRLKRSEDRLADAVENYLNLFHGNLDADVKTARYTIATAACNWLDDR